jgi:hypothetical protein
VIFLILQGLANNIASTGTNPYFTVYPHPLTNYYIYEIIFCRLVAHSVPKCAEVLNIKI